MKAVPGLILSAAALLQFFSGFASAGTCADVDGLGLPSSSYVCQTDGFVRDIDRDAIECVADADLCSDADCCIEGEICADWTCTTPGKRLEATGTRALCVDGTTGDPIACSETACCTRDGDTCTNYATCQGLGMELVTATLNTPLCTNECDDAQCCAVKSKCKHYTCDAPNMVLDPAKDAIPCSDGAVDGMCDDGICCMVTCASDGVLCAGTRLDDNVCTGVVNGAAGCDLVSDPVVDVCCTETRTCTQELHACPTGYHRIGTNICPETGLCTDALCCEANIVPTITESRMMQTPPSRQHLMQYGTS